MLTFSDEVIKINISVTIVDDTISEGDERFTADLQLVTSDASVLLDPAMTTILVLDDDSTYYGAHIVLQ